MIMYGWSKLVGGVRGWGEVGGEKGGRCTGTGGGYFVNMCRHIWVCALCVVRVHVLCIYVLFFILHSYNNSRI